MCDKNEYVREILDEKTGVMKLFPIPKIEDKKESNNYQGFSIVQGILIVIAILTACGLIMGLFVYALGSIAYYTPQNIKFSMGKIYHFSGNIIVVLATLFIIYLFIRYKIEAKSQFKEKTLDKIPVDCTPAVAGLLHNFKKRGKGNDLIYKVHLENMLANIMDLVRREYIKIDKDKRSLILNKDLHETLWDHEKELLTWIFNKLGNGEYVDKDLANSYSQYSEEVKCSPPSWARCIIWDSNKMGYLDTSGEKGEKLGNTVGIVLMGISVLGLLISQPWSISIIKIFICGLVVKLLSKAVNRRSELGVTTTAKFYGFKKYIVNTFKTNEFPYVGEETFRLYLVYSVTFGVYDKIVKIFYKNRGDSYDMYGREITNFIENLQIVNDIIQPQFYYEPEKK
ncbi:hypothetical protein SH2C18_46920 [Clostridium sediminicola]|uniref:DUF2207 family protein n=1 Tax=Clostridium sediminicola TaxID=3114879 RepID=UPI0031F25567